MSCIFLDQTLSLNIWIRSAVHKQKLTIFGQATKIFAKMSFDGKRNPPLRSALLLCHHHRGSHKRHWPPNVSWSRPVSHSTISYKQQTTKESREDFLLLSCRIRRKLWSGLWWRRSQNATTHRHNQWCCWWFTLYGLRYIRFANSQSLQRRTTWLKLNPRHTMNSNLDHTRQRSFFACAWYLPLVLSPVARVLCPVVIIIKELVYHYYKSSLKN